MEEKQIVTNPYYSINTWLKQTGTDGQFTPVSGGQRLRFSQVRSRNNLNIRLTHILPRFFISEANYLK